MWKCYTPSKLSQKAGLHRPCQDRAHWSAPWKVSWGHVSGVLRVHREVTDTLRVQAICSRHHHDQKELGAAGEIECVCFLPTAAGCDHGPQQDVWDCKRGCNLHWARSHQSWPANSHRTSFPGDQEHGGLCDLGGHIQNQKESYAIQRSFGRFWPVVVSNTCVLCHCLYLCMFTLNLLWW